MRYYNNQIYNDGVMIMKSFKPSMNAETALEILHEIGERDACDVEPIEMGELSRVFRFRSGEGHYVLHIREQETDIRKASFISDTFGDKLLIPRVRRTGRIGERHYAITDRAPGVPLSTLDKESIDNLIPELTGCLIRIHDVKPDEAPPEFGWLDAQGKAHFTSWTAYLLNTFREDIDGFYEGWTDLYGQGILEKETFDDYYSRLQELLEVVPNEACLVHGDFHTGNMLAEAGRMTGIVDWELAMYGDFMYDVAVMHMWAPHLQFPSAYRGAMERAGRDIPHFKERLICYQMYRALDGLRFYAKKDDASGYRLMKHMLGELTKDLLPNNGK